MVKSRMLFLINPVRRKLVIYWDEGRYLCSFHFFRTVKKSKNSEQERSLDLTSREQNPPPADK